MATILTTCFTDMESYTSQTEALGSVKMREIIDEHMRVGKALFAANGGKYVKEIGDAHMGTFDDPVNALQFAAEFQQYYMTTPCFEDRGLKFSIGIATGVVDNVKGVTFGSGVNLAARVESKANAFSVFVNDRLVDDINKILGKTETSKLFNSIGNVDLKGFKENEHELFEFDFEDYLENLSYVGLAKHVYKCIENSGSAISNLSAKALASPGHIIWPVVPRDFATAIHRGQIEIIRLLAKIGWKVHFLLADCGSLTNPGREKTSAFCKNIEEHAGFRNLINLEKSCLSYYYNIDNPEYKTVIDKFREITSNLSVETLIGFNEKNYSDEEKMKIQKEPMLDFLRPALTSAVVLHLTKTLSVSNVRTILIAGADERKQYDHWIDKDMKNLGAIYIPRLNNKPDDSGRKPHTARQLNNWPIWYSKEALKEDVKKTNAAKWLFQLFAKLPSFPSKDVVIDGTEIVIAQWKADEFFIPENIDDIINEVWPLIDTARK